VYQYVAEEGSRQGMVNLKRLGAGEWEVTGSDRYILDMLTVLRVCLGEIEKEYSHTN
jgi:hypothetical protein